MSKQDAVITKVEESKVFAEVQNRSACAHCQQKGSCSIMDCKSKIIEIPVDKNHNYQIGQNIVISVSDRAGLFAAFYAYILPLIIVVSALTITLFLSKNEEKSALFSIFSLILYYFLLFLCKKHFYKKINFRIEEWINTKFHF